MTQNVPPIPLSPGDEADVLAVVARLCRITGVPFDSSAARTSFLQACTGYRELPQWAAPLGEACRALGLRARPWTGSVRDAWGQARADLPMVTALTGPDGAPTWVVVGGRGAGGRIDVWEPTGRDEKNRMSWSAFTRRVGQGDPDALMPWLFVEPVAPAVDMLGAPGSRLGVFGRLWALLQAERADLGVILAYAVGIGILGLATPLVVQVLVNTVGFTALVTPVFVLTGLLMLCLAFAAVLRGLKRYAIEILQRRVFVQITADLAWRLPRVKASAWDRRRGAELVNHFFDVLTVQKAASSLLVDGLSAAISAAVGLLLLAVYHPALLGFGIFLVVSIVVLMAGLGRRGPDTAIAESKAKYRVAGWLEEVAEHPGLFKLPGGAQLALQRADDLAHYYLDKRESHFAIFFRQYVGTLGLQVVAASALLGLGGWLVVERQLSLGQLVAAELVVAAILAAYAKFADKLDIFYDLLAGLDKLGVLVDLPLESQTGSAPPPTGSPVELVLDGVSFSFPGAGPVLKSVDLAAEPGARVAICGKDGAGKSVLADLIFDLRTPSSGTIRFDGSDLRELRPKAVRQVAALSRGPEVVSGTVFENVALGRPEVTSDDVAHALRLVGLEDVVAALPEGISTQLAPSGEPLSDTQVLRLMIARAVAEQPRLLLIDHTLDALAPHAQGRVLDGLMDTEAPWTLIVFTQDPAVLSGFPRRYALVDGTLRVQEQKSRPLGVS